MSTHDDVPDPLAGIDLHAWQPPAPPAGQADAILARLDGTRTDVASAVEVDDRVLPRARPRPVRNRTQLALGVGIALGVAAAGLIAMIAWPSHGPEPRDWNRRWEGPIVGVSPVPNRAGGTVPADNQNREAENKRLFDELMDAAKQHDVRTVGELARRIPSDSIYSDPAHELHDKVRADFIDAEVAKARASAAKGDCKAIAKQAADATAIVADAGAAIRAVSCKTSHGPGATGASASCDPGAYLDAAREAGAASMWAVMLTKAQAAEACQSSTTGRQLALMAACRLGNKRVAKRYFPEFVNNTGMRQVCAGVVDATDFDFSGSSDDGSASAPAPATSVTPPTCDASALLDEARQAGGANQWSKMLSTAEAANKCSPSKGARQLALMAACRLKNRDKALRYWKEFETNTSMKQICASTGMVLADP